MKESERLRAAKALIADEKNWMQGEYYDLPGDAANSRCFCSLGAIRRTFVDNGERLPNGDMSPAALYLEKALCSDDPLFDEGDVPTFNDTHPHEDVLYMFDKAIELAETEGN